jgi:integrase
MASVHRYRTRKGDLRYDVRWRDGAGKQRSRVFSRRKDAERFRVEQDRARQLGQLYDAPPVRFGEFLAGWLARHERRVRPSMFEREAQSLRRFDVLSRYHVEEVTASRVEEIVMAGGTRQGQISLRLIKRVLANARARGQRVHEAVFAIEPPRHEMRDPRFLTWSEVEELASYCREHRLVVVAALSGLRRGELFALTAASVDLDGAAITVAATGDGGKVGRPKGGKVRRVHVERRVVELLAEQLRERVPTRRTLSSPRLEEKCGAATTSALGCLTPRSGGRRWTPRPAAHIRVAADRGERAANGRGGAARAHGRSPRSAALRAPVSGCRGAGWDGARPISEGRDCWADVRRIELRGHRGAVSADEY